MLTKGEFLDRLRENPLPEDVILQNSSLICGLFYYYGIHCRADEEAAECFWRGEVPKPCPAAEPGACGQTAAGPEAALRLALRYSPQGEDSRREAQEHFLEEMKSEFAPGKISGVYGRFLRVPGKDMTAGIPGRNRSGNRQRICMMRRILQTGKKIRCRRSVYTIRSRGHAFGSTGRRSCCTGWPPLAGTCGLLRRTFPENEYLNEPEFEDWIWEKLAQAVRDAEEKAAKFQRQEKLPGSGQMVDKIGSRRESIRHPGTDRLSGTVEGGAGQGKQACLLAGAGEKDFRRMRVS